MNTEKNYAQELVRAKKFMEVAIKNYFEACRKKLMSDAIERGIAEAKTKKQ